MASATTRAEPRRIAGYELGERIAVGGHAEVFAARSIADARDVVLKIPWPELAREPTFRASIEHEAALARTLAHPGIVEVLAVVEVDGVPALVLERVDGCTLAALLEALRARGETLPPETAVGVAAILLDALSHLHEASDERGRPLAAVHRDVTPRNVLISRHGDVKLADLGIARSRLRADRTRTGLVRGTPRYLSPEQATGSDVDARTDVYGVGLLLFEMLSGAPYLEGEGELELLRRAEDPPARPLDERFPSELRAAIARALARFPEERFPSARSFARALVPFASREVRDELGPRVVALLPERGPAEVSTDPAPTRVEATADPRRHAALRRVFALASVALGAIAVFALASGPSIRTHAPDVSEPRVSVAPAPRVEARHEDPARRPSLSSDPPPSGRLPALEPTTPEPAGRPRAHAGEDADRRGSEEVRVPESRAATTATAAVEPPTRVETPPPEAPPPAAPIDRASVERQLARANAALRDARAHGRDTAPLDPLATAALEAFAEGDYASASRKLDRLLAALAPL